MMLGVLKHGGTWEFLAQMFRIKSSTFKKMTTGFMQVIPKKANEIWIETV